MPRVEVSWDGFKWWVREGFRADAITLTKREFSVLKLLTLLSSKEKTFVEVGAHVGYYAVRMAPLYKQVIAIEPNPQNLECLRKNIELNGLTNVQVIPVACGEGEGTLPLGLMEGSSSFYRTNVPTVSVPVKRLDDLVQWGDVVKVDVEGWEEHVIKGAIRFIDRCKPIIVIEYHEFGYYPQAKGAFENIKRMLINYRRFNLDGCRFVHVHESRLKTLSREVLGFLLGRHWLLKMVSNERAGRPWYYGLPHTWWYGMGILDVIENLPEHVLEEPEWLELIRDD
jgi:FkbM family methyltransferase